MDFVYTFPARGPVSPPWVHFGMMFLTIFGCGAVPFAYYIYERPGKRVKAFLNGFILMAVITFFLHAWTYFPDYLEKISISEGTLRAYRHISGAEIWYAHETTSLHLVDGFKYPLTRRISIRTRTGTEYLIGPFSEAERLQVAQELMGALSMIPCRTGEMCWAKRPE